MTLKEQSTQNLKDFKKILDEMGVVFWLDGGTLLGAYRDKDFCIDDEDDVDLCTWDNYLYLLEDVVEKAESMGFNLLHKWELEICLERGGARIDLFFNRKNKGEAYTYLYEGDKRTRFVVIPSKFYEKLGDIVFKGEVFNTPFPIEDFLTLKYGDWKTPVHRSQYRCDNEDQNKFVRKDYEI